MEPLHRVVRWDADAIANWERVAPTPDDEPMARIGVLSPSFAAARELIPTWAADTPSDSWIEVQVRLGDGIAWGRWFRLAAWDSAPHDSRRTSFAAQRGPEGYVATDTLIVTAPPDLAQVRVLLCATPGADMPDLEAFTICASSGTPSAPASDALALPASAIPMPTLRSQYSYAEGAGWCSPTALTMVLSAWASQRNDTRLTPFANADAIPNLTAPMVYDPAWEGTGNWAFNVAFAAHCGLIAYVTRFQSVAQLARWTAAGVPVIISVAWDEGTIPNAPGRTNGHLTIVRGVTADQILIAEPASPDEAGVLRAYPANALFAAWQRASAGTVYLIYPPAWPRPEPGVSDAWV